MFVTGHRAVGMPPRSGDCTEGVDSEQAHVPTEQPSAREDPRLPAAHAHPCRPRHHRHAARQGARSPLGLATETGLTVLAADQRLRRADDFATVVRRGRRASRGGLVVHLRTTPSGEQSSPRAGFVVSRAVGPAVTRNRVRRRLRHLIRAELSRLGPGTDVVVRVLPAAASASYAELGGDLSAAASAAARRHEGRSIRA